MSGVMRLPRNPSAQHAACAADSAVTAWPLQGNNSVMGESKVTTGGCRTTAIELPIAVRSGLTAKPETGFSRVPPGAGSTYSERPAAAQAQQGPGPCPFELGLDSTTLMAGSPMGRFQLRRFN